MNRAAKLYDAHGEKLRYLMVGAWNTAFSYGLFAVAIAVAVRPMEDLTGWDHRAVAVTFQWAVWAVSVIQSTITMKYFVFRSSGKLTREIFRAYFIYLPAQGLSTVILWAGMTLLHLSAIVSQAGSVFITTILSYVGHKYFTFRTPPHTRVSPPEPAERVEGPGRTW